VRVGVCSARLFPSLHAHVGRGESAGNRAAATTVICKAFIDAESYLGAVRRAVRAHDASPLASWAQPCASHLTSQCCGFPNHGDGARAHAHGDGAPFFSARVRRRATGDGSCGRDGGLLLDQAAGRRARRRGPVGRPAGWIIPRADGERLGGGRRRGEPRGARPGVGGAALDHSGSTRPVVTHDGDDPSSRRGCARPRRFDSTCGDP